MLLEATRIRAPRWVSPFLRETVSCSVAEWHSGSWRSFSRDVRRVSESYEPF